MAKIITTAVFKTFQPDQLQLLPQSLDELIGKDHLVRVIRNVVDQMDLSKITNQYLGGGSSAFHPQMMIKVLLYAYAMRIYTGRKIARALRQDITFMWLAGRNTPGFRTINQFRSGVLKGTIEELFKSMLQFLIDQKLVRIEDYFVDGSTFAADGNQHRIVWKKNAGRYKTGVEEKCQKLFEEIDQLNIQEDQEYGERDYEETGEQGITQEVLAEQIERLNHVLQKTDLSGKERRRAKSLKKEVEKSAEKLEKYEDQLETAGSRSGYSKTDTDASAMRMKNDETLPAYNVVIGTTDQMIVHFTVHQSPGDVSALPEHLERLEEYTHEMPQRICADAGFGSEQNYEILEKKGIENYVKYNTYHSEQTRKHKANLFHKDNFPYDSATDTFTCPNKQSLTYRKTIPQKNRSGYKSTVKVYECVNCQNCPFAETCKQTDGNRTLHVNPQLERYKQQVRENLQNEKGRSLRKQRGYEVESVFGDIKKNQSFRRFHLRGKRKVEIEFGLVALAHNLRKVHLKSIIKAS